jgi:hypothetical protein
MQSHTILFVQIADVEGELSLQDHIVVEFIPIAQRSKLRPRKSSERAQVQSIYGQTHHVYEQQEA